jgi:hypothetical protein
LTDKLPYFIAALRDETILAGEIYFFYWYSGERLFQLLDRSSAMPGKKNNAMADDHFTFDLSASTLMAAADAYSMGGDWDHALEALAALLEEADPEPAKTLKHRAS